MTHNLCICSLICIIQVNNIVFINRKLPYEIKHLQDALY